MGAVIDGPGVLYAFTVTPEKTNRIYLSYPNEANTVSTQVRSDSDQKSVRIDDPKSCRFVFAVRYSLCTRPKVLVAKIWWCESAY